MSLLIGDSLQTLDSSVDELVLMLSSQEMSAPNTRPQVTKSIQVPTSEHVAQIVGKSGSKIKNLRSATQTCIKTPLRGDPPVFTISGTEANVEKVLNAIKQASDHFTKLMESRSHACAVGEVTKLIEVPQQYVGVVVGRNGSVIMKIKEQTRTRINTPKGDALHPAFEVTGAFHNVEAAKEAIEDKVRQALMLKDSTAYDPDLSHKSKSLNEAVEWPSGGRSAPTPSAIPSSSNHSFHIEVNSFKPLKTTNGWPPFQQQTSQQRESRAPSPHFYNPFNNFLAPQISPSFLAPNMNSFFLKE